MIPMSAPWFCKYGYSRPREEKGPSRDQQKMTLRSGARVKTVSNPLFVPRDKSMTLPGDRFLQKRFHCYSEFRMTSGPIPASCEQELLKTSLAMTHTHTHQERERERV
jgi:hypothetical protein